jgi:hypothetical protein
MQFLDELPPLDDLHITPSDSKCNCHRTSYIVYTTKQKHKLKHQHPDAFTTTSKL